MSFAEKHYQLMSSLPSEGISRQRLLSPMLVGIDEVQLDPRASIDTFESPRPSVDRKEDYENHFESSKR